MLDCPPLLTHGRSSMFFPVLVVVPKMKHVGRLLISAPPNPVAICMTSRIRVWPTMIVWHLVFLVACSLLSAYRAERSLISDVTDIVSDSDEENAEALIGVASGTKVPPRPS